MGHGDGAFEVVLVPLDTVEADWRSYMQSMPWLSLPLECRDPIVRLFLHFSISEAPRLIIIDPAGSVVSSNARGGKGFGFGCDPLQAYRHLIKALEQREEDDEWIEQPSLS